MFWFLKKELLEQKANAGVIVGISIFAHPLLYFFIVLSEGEKPTTRGVGGGM
jgi:hypothetical protein